jgi:uncharacterized damage-inducible protein DinB
MTTTDSKLATLFLNFSRDKLVNEFWPRLKICVEPMTVEQLWWRPNDASNSVGNLLLHLNGNVTQWLVTSFNKVEDKRDRPAEFAAEGGQTAVELLERLGATIAAADAALKRLTAEELLAPYEIQGYHMTALEAIYHVLEHFSLHYGQISYISKSLSGKDLGFYSYLNKAGRK